MVERIIICVLLAFAIGKIIFDATRAPKNKMSFKEALDLSGLPVVTFISNGVKLNFMLDTGSNASYINKSVLPLLEYTEHNIQDEVMGATGNAFVTFVKFPIQYKDLTIEALFGAMDLDAQFSEIKADTGVTVHGILGTDVFQLCNYVFDFKDYIAYCR